MVPVEQDGFPLAVGIRVAKGTQALALLRQYVDDSLAQLESQSLQQRLDTLASRLPPEERDGFSSLLQQWLPTLAHDFGLTDPASRLRRRKRLQSPEEYTPLLHSVVSEFGRPEMYKELLFQMALTHAFALFEALLQDNLAAVLRLHPNTLISRAPITWEEVLQSQDKQGLVGSLAKRRASSLVEGGLKSFAEDLALEPFHIELRRLPEFATLFEAQQRRDTVVHSAGRADARYRSHTGQAEGAPPPRIDHAYLTRLFDAMSNFVEYLNTALAQQLHYTYVSKYNALLPNAVPPAAYTRFL